MARVTSAVRDQQPDIVIVDVGHGNCAIIHENDHVTLIDAGLGRTVIEALDERGIRRVDTVLVSHADADHIGGLLTLLLDEELGVGEVFCNSDSVKDTKAWRQLVYALEDARVKKGTVTTPALTDTTRVTGHASVSIEILAPPAWRALTGAGTTSRGGEVMSGNSLSAVVRVLSEGNPLALFAADIDGVALADLVTRGVALDARLLVFPHHGGWPGGADPATFARDLCALVRPQVVVFSLGRGKHDTPQPEIVAAIRAALPGAHIICTQLSERCAAAVPEAPPSHLSGRTAKGAAGRACCGGTLVLDLQGTGVLAAPVITAHEAFMTAHAPNAVCRATVATAAAPTATPHVAALRRAERPPTD